MLIVKKFIRTFPPDGLVPTKYKNLRKAKHVKTFSRPFPTIPEILVKEYGLTWEDKIIVFHTKVIPHFKGFKNYRTPFKKVYYGTVEGFKPYLLEFLEHVRRRYKRL